MDFKSVCHQLINAETEQDVTDIIKKYPEFSNSSNWKPLDGRETNFNVTSNQASDGGKALTELMTNMVDAVLLKNAYANNIDPKGPDAPKTMYGAVDQLIKNLRGGKLTNLDPNDSWLREYAQENLIIGITGSKLKKDGMPSYTFVDNGEGQAPDNFENTFLSLSAGTKKSIPFVQGKFNMGSSGVLKYCGNEWYKLIVSRRYDGETPWGWTIVRRRPVSAEELPVAEYFCPEGIMPRFQERRIHPFRIHNGDEYDGVSLETGTIIKLYDYNVGTANLTFRGARDAMVENLVETILPFRLLDFRQTPDSKRGGDRALGIDPRPFYGMEYLLLRSHKEDDSEDTEDEVMGESRISIATIPDAKLGEIKIHAVLLKRKLPSWLSNNRIFHSVNGQVQFKQTRGYLSQQCKLPGLKDRIVVIVDASKLSFKAHNEVWKGDREHINNTIWGERYKDLVTKAIRDSQALKELQERIAKEELERTKESESDELFQKLVSTDRNFAGLLSLRNPKIRLPGSGDGEGNNSGNNPFEGNYSPTFLKLDDRSHDIKFPINRTRPVAATTDAENGYLDRADNCGRLIIDPQIIEKFTIRQSLHNGKLVIYMEPGPDLEVGDTFKFKIVLQDDAMPSPIESEEISITISEKEKENSQAKKQKTKLESGDDKNEKGKSVPSVGLPHFRLLTHDGRKISDAESQKWPEGFDENDGGYVDDLGDERIYYINYDNSYHLKYREQQRGDLAKEVVTEKYILGMRIMMLGFEQSVQIVLKSEDTANENIAEHMDDFRKHAARGAASTVLAIAENLHKIVDVSTMKVDDE